MVWLTAQASAAHHWGYTHTHTYSPFYYWFNPLNIRDIISKQCIGALISHSSSEWHHTLTKGQETKSSTWEAVYSHYPPLTPWNKKTVMYNSQHDHIAGRDMPTFIIHARFTDMQSPFFLHFLLSFSLGKQLKWVWTHKEGERDLIFYFIRFYVAHSLFINMTHGQSNVPVMPIKLCWQKKRDIKSDHPACALLTAK